MATGLLIRDFEKDDRELRYSNSGSIRFTEIEHNAYRLSLTLEITHIDAPRYGNKKTLPDNTHYGYATFFKGSTVTESVAVKFPKFRLFDIINQGIWNYHQATETIQIVDALSETLFSEQSSFILDAIDDTLGISFCSVVNFALPGSEGSVDELFRVLVGCDDFNEPGFRPLSSQYRGFPVASPFPDVVKFKADVPCSFLFRLEQWFLVNPAVYIADNPTDTGDETEDEDEYPEPEQGDGDGDGDEFPDSDAPDPDSDPKDFPSPENGSPGVGSQAQVRVMLTALSEGCDSETLSFPSTVTIGEVSEEFSGFAPGNDYACSPGAYLGWRVKFGGRVYGPFDTGGGVVSVELIKVVYDGSLIGG